MISLPEIEKLAALARIELSDGEKKNLQKDVGAILEYVTLVQNVTGKKEGLEEHGPVNVMREDSEPHESGLYTEKLLSAAPQREGQYIRVKKIL